VAAIDAASPQQMLYTRNWQPCLRKVHVRKETNDATLAGHQLLKKGMAAN